MIGMVDSERDINGHITREARFYIGSIGTEAATFARSVCVHWGENRLHWSLDVSFNEDASWMRDPPARQTLAVLRHIALTQLKQTPPSSASRAGASEGRLA